MPEEIFARRCERRNSVLASHWLSDHALFALILLLLLAASAPPSRAQVQQAKAARATLLVIVHDENGVAVASARVTLHPPGQATLIQGETDFAGRQEFTDLPGGTYHLEVEKEGFYALAEQEVHVGETGSVEVTLNHQQEYKETVHVNYSPATINPAQSAANEKLNAEEVLEVPYVTTRDVRNIFPFLPGVTPDANGQIHVNGSSSNEVLYTLDGFDVTLPVSGLNSLRVSTDAVRAIDVQGSRYSAAYGKGSGGVLNLETGMGDDHFRFYATDFVPTFQQHRGFHFQNVTPRFTFSGPLEKGKAWFSDAVEGEYNLDIFTELPPGADREHFWRWSNLARAQVNLTPGNRLISSFLVNRSDGDHNGLSLTQPLSTTTQLAQDAYLATLKDQSTWGNGGLLEVGFGFNQNSFDQLPLGALPYVVFPGTAFGNFYHTSDGVSRRFEGIANFFFPAARWHGRHQFEIGTDLERLDDGTLALRRAFSICSNTPPPGPPSGPCATSTIVGTLERAVSFSTTPRAGKNNFAAGWFAQDRWSASERLLVEMGIRLDVDEIIRRALVAPRLAASYMLTGDGETKLSLGAGLYYDRTDLELLTRSLAGQRQDIFFMSDGVTPIGPPVLTTFKVNQSQLLPPKFLNWSAGLERKLPAAVYLRVDYVQKRGFDGFDYENAPPASSLPLPSGLFDLHNHRRDHYDGVTLTLRRTFKERYPLMASYTRSSARSNAVLDSTIDNPLFSPQLGGRLPWDTPDRVVSWGWVPLIKGFELAYSLDWHSGYPFSLINKEQELVGLPDRTRFPDFFSLNVHLEKHFHLFGFQWAIRAGFNNVTSRENPGAVDNNVDSPTFGKFGAFEHRAFTGRIRFLGRK